MSIVDWQLVASDLEQQLIHISAELVHRSAELTGAFHQLAASQAREQKLREALQFYMTPPIGQLNDHHIAAAKLGVAALALPTDDTALQARLKEEQERCAKVCDEFQKTSYLSVGTTLARMIRELS